MKMVCYLLVASTWVISLLITPLAQAHPTSPNQRTTYGRCSFPSTRLLSILMGQQLQSAYQKAGYKKAWVSVRVVKQRIKNVAVSLQNVTGFQTAFPNPANPTQVEIRANGGGELVNMPCSTEVTVQTQVNLVGPDGKASSGTSNSTIVVEGSFY